MSQCREGVSEELLVRLGMQNVYIFGFMLPQCFFIGMRTVFHRSASQGVSNVTLLSYPLSQAGVESPLGIQKVALTAKVSRCARMMQAGGTNIHLVQPPLSTVGGWHTGSNRTLCSVATTIAAKGISSLRSAKSILSHRHAALLETNNALCQMLGLLASQSLFQRHAALLVANNAVCLISGFDLRI